MAPSSSSSSPATSVQVALRIRPPTTQDSTSIPARFQRSVIQATTATSVAIESPSSISQGTSAATAASQSAAAKKQVFSFDQVHPPVTTQYEIFTSTARPLVSRFVEGFNCTILAYGQTSSGKTFTMTGIDLDADPSDPNNGMGIIPRAVSTIFSTAKQLKDERGGAWNFNVKGSFIEIYNEDLIDLLSLDDPNGGKREVQIREDKEGHIIWGGLREVNVRNASEVMTLLRKGTSIRRTNETDMNAQSSRSHAIFSLTLTQKKYTGSAPPPRSSSPLPPGGRSPSRLARPGSMYASGVSGARVSSPTFGRPATPSFVAAMGRGGGLRPASALGHTGDRPSVNGPDDDTGEWVTIVSKFHFVDLAGSERLKRTAAAGERIKEGISINSGLLALGNVISALGDPSRAKSNTASHVPYRDSKLTRLLQDSLGGNAHTLMVACVSPAEWNAGETINTLKYANRARNIKNRAVVNEKEDGWDDIDWLQSMVTRLRKEMKMLKDGGGLGTSDREPEVLEGAGKKVLAQMTELQNNYEDLREKFVERTEELTRLRRELGEKHRGSTLGSVGGTAKYEEIVGPVIEEYEKTIAAMEAELNLNRVALRHTNEMVEEKEDELAAITERHAATELYVEELRARVAKLSEREASTEAYVRDLEEKMKAYDETSITSSESMSDLKREIVRFKDAESYSTKYIIDLEARLGRSDESILGLQQTVAKLENECQRRRDEVETLQSRLETLRRDGDSWRTDLEEREKKVKELEEKMLDWERKKEEAGEARARLGNVVGEVESARRSLEVDLSGTSSSPSPVSATLAETVPTILGSRSLPASDQAEVTIQAQLVSLQQTHTATLADLSSVTDKYRDALREISDLAAQIQEAKLNPSITETTYADSPAVDKPGEIPPIRRRVAGGRSREVSDASQYNSAGRRLFFRQAASAESLHSRSLSQSQSLSQELSSVHSRKTSFSSHGTSSSHSPSNSHSHSQSSSTLYAMGLRPNLSISLPAMSPVVQTHERSVSSLEKEIMRLQEVLKEREAEITLLEESLRQKQVLEPALSVPLTNGEQSLTNGSSADSTLSPKTINQFDHIRKTMESNGHTNPEENGSAVYSDHDESLERLNELMLSMAQKESYHREVVDELNTQLSQTKRQLDDLTALSRDQAVNMSMEIEALQGKHHDDLLLLEEVRKREVELLETIQLVQSAHKADVDSLRMRHENAMKTKGSEINDLVARLTEEHETSVASLRGELEQAKTTLLKAHKEHEEAFGKLKSEHDKELQHHIYTANEALLSTRQDQEKSLARLQTEHEAFLRQKEDEAAAALQTTEEEYYNALTKLRGDHIESVKRVVEETNATIERLREEHAGELRMAEISREGSISESESSRNLALKDLQEEHAAAIARKEASFLEEVENLDSRHKRALKVKDEDYTLQIDRLRLEHETTIMKLKSEWRIESEQRSFDADAAKDEALRRLSDDLKAKSDQALEKVREQQALVLTEVERAHEVEVSKLKDAHEVTLRNVRSQSEAEKSALASRHADETAQHTSALSAATAQFQAEKSALMLSHAEAIAIALQEAHANFEYERSKLASDHAKEVTRLNDALQNVNMDAQADRAVLISNHTDIVAKLEQEQQNAILALTANLQNLEEKYQHAEHVLETEMQRLLSGEKEQSAQTLEALRQQHAKELETLRGGYDSTVQELETYKVAADEFNDIREETWRKHEEQLAESLMGMAGLEKQLSSVNAERDSLRDELARMRLELDQTRNEQSKLIQEASKRESLVDELERHRSVLAELQENLQRVKDEKDSLQMEKSRSDSLVRDLQAQVARSASPPNARSPDRSMAFNRAAALPPIKLPPPTPPPSIPPPPAPRAMNAQHVNGESNFSTSSQASSSAFNSSASSRESQPDSPSTSAGHLTPNGAPPPLDPKVTARLEQQAKQIDEQEAMIKTLNKQLTHCESDLQTHMDLVNTLENSLGDSEKNLRKARMQATELARERDTLTNKLEALRGELSDAKREVVTVRRSIVEEKQSLEQRLDEERKAKERARQQLDSRMDELQKRKSKFACL